MRAMVGTKDRFHLAARNEQKLKGGAVRVKEAAARLEVCASTVYQLIESGVLGHYRIGTGRGVVRITEDHIAEYLARSEQVAKPLPAPAPKREIRLRHLRRA